jgi:hypothetical protein
VNGLKVLRNAVSLSRSRLLLLLLLVEARAFWRRGLPDEDRLVGEKGEVEWLVSRLMLVLRLRKVESGEGAAPRPDRGDEVEGLADVLRPEVGVDGPNALLLPVPEGEWEGEEVRL